ncbi:MAG TPA: alpha amylase C-terminal domain-containing protein, partial [Chakrabartia sp.]|nr:alpha amylase C-terminal domain-containing protein [Chakrabartia sp.]
RRDYRVPLPHDGLWREVLNSDARLYGGSGVGNFGEVTAQDGSASMTLPPLATIMLEFAN